MLPFSMSSSPCELTWVLLSPTIAHTGDGLFGHLNSGTTECITLARQRVLCSPSYKLSRQADCLAALVCCLNPMCLWADILFLMELEKSTNKIGRLSLLTLFASLLLGLWFGEHSQEPGRISGWPMAHVRRNKTPCFRREFCATFDNPWRNGNHKEHNSANNGIGFWESSLKPTVRIVFHSSYICIFFSKHFKPYFYFLMLRNFSSLLRHHHRFHLAQPLAGSMMQWFVSLN